MQIKYHLAFLFFRYSNAYQMPTSSFCISLPHHAIFELPPPALFSPASRASPAPYSPGLPPPVPPSPTERSVRGRIILASSSLCKKTENSNELQTLLHRQHYLFVSWFSKFYCLMSVDPWFKPLTSKVTSVISSNPTRPSDRPRRSHSFHRI